eukprot:scaffold265_cov131-Cylindrotheca_fusiformis.AAC.16
MQHKDDMLKRAADRVFQRLFNIPLADFCDVMSGSPECRCRFMHEQTFNTMLDKRGRLSDIRNDGDKKESIVSK